MLLESESLICGEQAEGLQEARARYPFPMKHWRRIQLFLGIVGRYNQADYRNGIKLSWEIAKIIWP